MYILIDIDSNLELRLSYCLTEEEYNLLPQYQKQYYKQF